MKRFVDSNDPDRPVIGLEDEYPPGFTDLSHSHNRAQLLYASSGVMSVVVDAASFVIPPQRAVWVPAGMAHEVSCRGHVSLRTLYFDRSVHDRGDGSCRVIEVSDFLKALILEVTHFGGEYGTETREARIVHLLVEEIEAMPIAPYRVPMPSDHRLLRVCRQILQEPANHRDLDEWACTAGMGRRTFTRLFKEQTGMGLAVWRQQARLMEALSLLATGVPITTVAFDVGYESPSAFTAMFHRAFGVPPSQYRLV